MSIWKYLIISVVFYQKCLTFIEDEYTAEKRILGGRIATIDEIPYIVNVEEKGYVAAGKYAHVCGGSYIRPFFVITAAHCLYSSEHNSTKPKTQTSVGNQERFMLRMGASTLSSKISQGRRSVNLYIHKKYDPANDAFDIGLVRIKHPFRLGPNVRMIKLMTSPKIRDNAVGLVGGWGYTHPNKPQVSNEIRIAFLPIIKRDVCKKKFTDTGTVGDLSFLDERVICAGFKGSEACQGDSGGPLVLDNTYLLGIVSWSAGCGAGLPGIFTNITYHLSFIRAIVKKEKQSCSSQLVVSVSLFVTIIIKCCI